VTILNAAGFKFPTIKTVVVKALNVAEDEAKSIYSAIAGIF
jgi:hypothetical protein